MPVRVGEFFGLDSGVDTDFNGTGQALCDIGLIDVDDIDDCTPPTSFRLDKDGIIIVLGSIVPCQGVLAVGRDSRELLTDAVVEEDLSSVVAQSSRYKGTIVRHVSVIRTVSSEVDVDSSADVPTRENGMEGHLAIRVRLSYTSQESLLVGGQA